MNPPKTEPVFQEIWFSAQRREADAIPRISHLSSLAEPELRSRLSGGSEGYNSFRPTRFPAVH